MNNTTHHYSPCPRRRESSRKYFSLDARLRGHDGFKAGVALVLAFCATTAFAQQPNCVALKTDAQMEQEYTDAQGKPAKRLVAPGKVVPGNEVIWTISATNVCAKAAEKVVIDNAVPEHMVYVADSAGGPGMTITYSLNGRDFAKAADLTVQEAGKTRAARANEIKALRWQLSTPIPAGSAVYARYRAKVK
jgi:uncharacterized repeat protein (TIGR01451 family)